MASIIETTILEDERRSLGALIRALTTEYESVNDPGFVAKMPVFAEDLPKRLRKAIAAYKYATEPSVLVFRGFTLSEDEVGPTPNHWNQTPSPKTAGDYFATLMSFALGDVFGFSNLQSGKLIQEIFPVREEAKEQLGTGSVELFLHTEDSSLDYRADYLGFFCNRNLDAIPTDVAFIDAKELSASSRELLRQKAFKIYNDRPVFTAEERKNEQFNVCAVLYGEEGDLRVRYDPLYTEMSELTEAQKVALDELVKLAERNVKPVVLSAGDMAFIDNTRCAHGRRAYTPRYDGRDRWLKRTQISNRLREYRHLMRPGRVFP